MQGSESITVILMQEQALRAIRLMIGNGHDGFKIFVPTKQADDGLLDFRRKQTSAHDGLTMTCPLLCPLVIMHRGLEVTRACK